MSSKKKIIDEKSINDINYEKLKEIFPSAVSVDEEGKYIISKEQLQMYLDPSKADIKEDGYGLNWVGKKEAYHKAYTKNTKVLKPLLDESKEWDKTENILIKGDNLDALKILRHNYFEAIKMIYIDPPYNTKNDGFVYNDDFTQTEKDTLEELGYDTEYKDYIENIQGAKTHSGWLSFIYPRLLLAKDLLKDEGVIFISIDDNEVAQLKILCDEIFGESNFVATIPVVMNLKGNQDSFGFAETHEYFLVYSKSKDNCYINQFKIDEEELIKDWKEDEFGLFKEADNLRATGENAPREKRPNLWYPIFVNEKTEEFYVTNNDEPINDTDLAVLPINKDDEELSWYWEKPTFENKKNNLILKKTKNGWQFYRKQRPEIGEQPTKKPKSFFYKSDYSTSTATTHLKNLMDKKIFKAPKPVPFLNDLIVLGSNENDIILDFFAGSGTTAHAVMDLNKDGGNRKYIAVQWAEETPQKSEAKKAGYDTIFDITKARIDKAGEKIKKENDSIDIGFRTFEIVEDSKEKIYQIGLDKASQNDLLTFIENEVVESNEDILYNLLVAEKLPLSTKIEELIKDKLFIASNVVFVLGDIDLEKFKQQLKDKKEIEYITVYSPNISDDNFSLELENTVSEIGLKSDKLNFRG